MHAECKFTLRRQPTEPSRCQCCLTAVLSGTMRLIIRGIDGVVTTLFASPTTYIEEVKQLYVQYWSFVNPLEAIRFIHRVQLEDCRTVAEYGLQDCSTIHVALRLRGD
jgi:hypothetical protein